jgi:hypothetical protein
LRRRNRTQLVAGDHARLLAFHQADLACDGQRRVRVVAGNHDDADSGAGAACDGIRHFRPRRVFEADQPGQDHAALFVGQPIGDGAMGEGQHAQPGFRHLLLRRQQAGFCHRIERRDAGVELHEITGGEHHFRRALAIQHVALRRRAQHRHALAVGVEGQLVDAPVIGQFASDPLSHRRQRHFHGIAQQLPVDGLYAVAKRGIDEQLAVVGGQSGLRRQVGEVEEAAAQPQALHRHQVLRQGACLVAANRGGGTQGLDRGQVAHQGIALRHALRRQRQRQGHGRQQPFRHIGDDDADREQGVLPGRQAHGLADEEHRQAHAGGQRRDDARQARDLPLQRRRRLAGGLRQVGDAAELGAHACRVNHGLRLSGHHRGSGQHHVLRIQRRVLAARFGVARLGQGLAGDRRGIHAQAEGLDQAAVGRNEVAFFQQQDVARHQPGGEHFHDRAAAPHLHLLRQQLAQRRHGLFRLVFLPEGKNAVDEDDADYRDAEAAHALAGIELLGDEGQRGAYPQDDGEEMGELAGEGEQQVLARHFLDMVGPELRQPACRLVGVEAGGGSLQAGERLPDVEAMDVHGRLPFSGRRGAAVAPAMRRSRRAGRAPARRRPR